MVRKWSKMAKGKIVQNGKIDKNQTGSSHGEQLEPKRLTLMRIADEFFSLDTN